MTLEPAVLPACEEIPFLLKQAVVAVVGEHAELVGELHPEAS